MPFRRRLTIAFVLAVGVGAAALAVGSYVVVRHNLRADSVRTAAREARRNLEIAPEYKRSDALLERIRGAGLRDGRDSNAGRPSSPASPSACLRFRPSCGRLVARGGFGYQRTTVAGTQYLVVGGPAGGRRALLLLLRGEPPPRADRPPQHPARRARDRGAARGSHRRAARSADASPCRAGERRRALARGRAPGDTAPGRGAGRVRRLGPGVQRDGGGAGGEDRGAESRRRPASGASPRTSRTSCGRR